MAVLVFSFTGRVVNARAVMSTCLAPDDAVDTAAWLNAVIVGLAGKGLGVVELVAAVAPVPVGVLAEGVVALPVCAPTADEAVHAPAVARRLLTHAPPTALQVLLRPTSVARHLAARQATLCEGSTVRKMFQGKGRNQDRFLARSF